MFGIGQFFSKIQDAYAREILVRKEIQEVLDRVVGIKIEIEKISFKGGVVELKGLSSAAKSTLFIKKSAVLKELEKIKKVRVVSDIK